MKIVQALIIAAIVYGLARLVGIEEFGKIAAPIASLVTALLPKAKRERDLTVAALRHVKVHARIDEGFTAGLLAGIVVSVALVRGYLMLAPTLSLLSFSAEVACSFVPVTTLLGIAIAITDARGASVTTRRTWLINEVVLATLVTVVGGALSGIVIGWYFSQYHMVRPFAPPELLLSGCIPAGAVIGIALAAPPGQRLDRRVVLPFVILSFVVASFTILAVVLADVADLGQRLMMLMYESPTAAFAAIGGALYGAITGFAVGITAGLTMFLLRSALSRRA
jgi:hypothetical protein